MLLSSDEENISKTTELLMPHYKRDEKRKPSKIERIVSSFKDERAKRRNSG